MIDLLFHISIGACIYMFDFWLGNGFLLYLLQQLYKFYKVKQNYKSMAKILESQGYEQVEPGIYQPKKREVDKDVQKLLAALEELDKPKKSGNDGEGSGGIWH